MEYTEAQVREAHLQDEVARYADMLTRPRRALDGVALTAFEDCTDPAIELTHDDIDGARYELTARFGGMLDTGDVESAVLSLSGGERDEASQARALVELAAMSPREVTRLVADRTAALTVTAGHRRRLATEGQALPGGAFPVHDLHHLRYAEVQHKEGNNAGHPASVVRAHLKKAAARLGVDSKLDDGDEDDGQDESRPRQRKARKAPRTSQHGQRAGEEGGDGFGGGASGMDTGGPSGGDGAAMTVSLADDPVGYYVALANEENVSSGPLQKHFDFEIHDVGSHPESGSPSVDVEREVARYLAQCSEKPISGNRKGRLAGRYPGTGPSGKPQSYR